MENNPNASKMYQKKWFMLLNIIVWKSDQENIWLSDCVWVLGGSRSAAIKCHAHVLRSQPVLYEKVVPHYTLMFFWACEEVFKNSVLKQFPKKHFLWK